MRFASLSQALRAPGLVCVRLLLAWLFTAAPMVAGHIGVPLSSAIPAEGGQLPAKFASVVAVGVVAVGADFKHADLTTHVVEWLDTKGSTSFEAMLDGQRKGALMFTPSPNHQTVRDLEGQRALWLKVVLNYSVDVRNDHYVVVPLSYIDDVQFFVQEADGRVQRFRAGDTIDIRLWPEITRYPALKLHPASGSQRTLYLRVSQGTRSILPIWLSDAAHFQYEERSDLLLFGAMAGAILVLMIVCLLQAFVYRDSDYAKFAGFSFLLLVGAATYCGITAMILPYNTQMWADVSQAVLLCLAVSGGLFLILLVVGGGGGGSSIASRRTTRFLQISAWAGLPLAVLVLAVARPTAAALVGSYAIVAVVGAVLVAVQAWRVRSTAALWMTLAFSPLLGLMLVVSARLAGFAVSVWLTNHAMMVGSLVHLPLMLMALGVRSRDRHMAEARASALERQDALTGLLATHVFNDRLAVACARYERRQESAAVVVFRIANFQRLREQLGSQVSDELLLRATIRLRRVIADSENLARLGESRFGLILEGEDTRQSVQELCARLIAVGLMPIKGLPKGVTLNFQCAVMVFSECFVSAPACLVALQGKLDGFSSRTRRPIRFLDASDLRMGSGFDQRPPPTDPVGASAARSWSAAPPQMVASTQPMALIDDTADDYTDPIPLVDKDPHSSSGSDFNSASRPSTNFQAEHANPRRGAQKP